jgi:transposase-like protein
VAKELGVSVPTLYYWAKVRQAEVISESPATESLAALKAENESLRSENEKLQRQKQILRRALEIMSENPKLSSQPALA